MSSVTYERFLALHHQPAGFVMPNAWDGLSAALVRDAGFAATATSSAALAFSLGRPDGRHAVSLGEHLTHARLLASASGLPVNGDLEDGYAATPEGVAATVEAAIGAGLAGIGIEDTSGDPSSPIRGYDQAVARLAAAARAAKGRIVLTGRTDNYLHGRPDLDDTLRRLTAFADAGADVLYAPGLPDMETIERVITAVAPVPVNVLIGPSDGRPTVAELLAAGVARISLGGALYLRAMDGARGALAEIVAGEVGSVRSGFSGAAATRLVTG